MTIYGGIETSKNRISHAGVHSFIFYCYLLLTYGQWRCLLLQVTKYWPRLLLPLLLLLLLVYAQLLFSAVPPTFEMSATRYFDHDHGLVSCMEAGRRP